MKKNSNLKIKQSVVAFVTLLILLSIFPFAKAQQTVPNMNFSDDTWIDEFDNISGIDVVRSSNFSVVNGNAVISTGVKIILCDFNDKESMNYGAYGGSIALPSIFNVSQRLSEILSPQNMIEWSLLDIVYKYSEFDNNQYLSLMKKNDGKYASTSKAVLGNTVFHYFKFKVSESKIHIRAITPYWKGKIEGSTNEIRMYVWNNSYTLLGMGFLKGRWVEVDHTQEKTGITLSSTLFDTDNYVDDDGYIHILIVAAGNVLSSFSLASDYVKVDVEAEIYNTNAIIISKEITVDESNISRWGYFVWDDVVLPGKTSIKYQILYHPDKRPVGVFEPISDDLLPGNEEGFTKPPVDLSRLNLSSGEFYTLRLKANLTTTDPSITPKIKRWGITWQKYDNYWLDNFSTNLRVDKLENLNIENSSVNITLGRANWPMFGFNLKNVRAFPGMGPKSFDELRLKTPSGVGGSSPPVIVNGVMYVVSNKYNVLYAIPANATGKVVKPLQTSSKIDPVYGSPLATEDFIIVATSNSSLLKDVKNKVYAFYRENISEKAWEYSYSGADTSICFSGSPVVHDGKIFLTAWSGKYKLADILSGLGESKGKLIAIDEYTGKPIWTPFELPAPSLCTPAVDSGMVFVGCENINGSSLFAIDEESGKAIWESNELGPIGRIAPVISGDKIIVTYAQLSTPVIGQATTHLAAVYKDNGTLAWDVEIGNITLSTKYPTEIPFLGHLEIGSSTPVVYDNKVFVASSDGVVYSVNITTGEIIWEYEVSKEGFLPQNLGTGVIYSSPVIADNVLYIATQLGIIYALDVDTGIEICEPFKADAGFISSPIVVDGILYICDNAGRIYAFGEPKIQYNMQGRIVSNIIRPPVGKWWHTFYADSSVDGKFIYSILDENYNTLLYNIKNGDNLSSLKTNKIRLCADISRNDVSQNPTLNTWSISFVDETDFPGEWNDLTPQGYSNEELVNCTIDVADKTSGLDVSSARYAVNYSIVAANVTLQPLIDGLLKTIIEENPKQFGKIVNYSLYGENLPRYLYTQWAKATCFPSINGSKAVTIIAYNVPLTPDALRNKLPMKLFDEYLGEYGNNYLIEINGVEFQISDLAGNVNNSITYEIQVDTEPPTSNITFISPEAFSDGTYKWYGINDISLIVKAQDDKSGLSMVLLYYKYSENGANWSDWELFANLTPYEPSSFSPVYNGFYKLCSIAVDKAGNYENLDGKEEKGNVSFIVVDTEKPRAYYDPEADHWYNSSAPKIKINFTDNMALKSIEYQLSNTTWESNWITIDDNIGSRFYNKTFQIDSSIWQSINPGLTYYLIFRINDYGNNENITIEKPYKIGKDIDRPRSEIQAFNVKWHSSLPIKVTARAIDGTSSVSKVTLYYSYSPDNKTWTDWKAYKEGKYIGNGTWEWKFDAPNGNGYYKFYTVSNDEAGNVEYKEGYEIVTGVNALPLTQIIIAIVLLIVAVILAIYIGLIRRK
ncbi:MAG: PQQ-binding-like beta-propeller repeat protein [Thermoplasmata archaeon]|nr:PQQ-binding-like beta-propeller repeat protein [Thermoplasmata archaeon]